MKRGPAVRCSHTVLAGLLALFVAVAATQAGQISIRPLGLVLSGEQPIRTFTVTNPGAEPVTVQIETLSWRQHDDNDELTPTRELLVTPPVITIPPAESQLVRVGLRRAPEPSRELSYRVRFREVPPPPEPGFTGLVVALNISVPVFVEPPEAVAADTQWQARMAGSGELELQVANQGSAHLKVSKVSVLTQGNEIGSRKTLLYVLPGSSQSLRVPVDRALASGTSLDIEARTGHDTRTFQVRVD